MGVGDENYPSDYEPCGQCGFDHAYEMESATAWHVKEVECGHCFGVSLRTAARWRMFV